MSDENGIEGVLSSIRRLVSEGEPGEETVATGKPRTVRPRSEPLLLTPSVQTSPMSKPPETTGESDAPASGFDQPIFKQSKGQKRAARRGRDASHAVTRPVAEPLTLRNPISVPGPQGAGDGPSPFRAQSEPLILTPSDVVRGPKSLPLTDAPDAAAAPETNADDAAAREVEAALEARVSALQDAVAVMALKAADETLSGTRPGLDTTDEQPAPQSEPAGEGQPVLSETAEPETSSTEDPTPTPPEPEAPAEEPAPAQLARSEDEMRAMMRRTLLAELEGELGERITRNLQKMIRREIETVLAHRDAQD